SGKKLSAFFFHLKTAANFQIFTICIEVTHYIKLSAITTNRMYIKQYKLAKVHEIKYNSSTQNLSSQLDSECHCLDDLTWNEP
ncbi:MAG: hypothetical protein ACTS7I_02665, partial [Candidatus Hodgkinia cicadicola]